MSMTLLLCTASLALALPLQSQATSCDMPVTTTVTTSTSTANNPDAASVLRWLPDSQKVKGVNLGSQFIIEPWMANDDFAYMGCGGLEDEWSCVQKLGQENADKVFARHWDTWITNEEIGKISAYGLNVIRIPVGFWLKEDLVYDWEHYPRGGLPYLDRLAGWAADAGLHVIIDLHGGPGNQAVNQSFTGHKTPDVWFYNHENFERATQFLEWMAFRIHTRTEYRTTGVIEVMNEPVSKKDFPMETANMLRNFYPEAYRRIRSAEASLDIPPAQELRIQYMSKKWGSGDPMKYMPENTTNILFDDHLYYSFPPDAPETKNGVIKAACKSTHAGSNTIVGEWSLSVKNDSVADPRSDKEWYKTYFSTQIQTYEQTGGWIFWTWKCNWIGGQDEWRWCYESAVANGIIPVSPISQTDSYCLTSNSTASQS